MGYLLSLGDLNNSNNSWMQINILKIFNLDKLEKKEINYCLGSWKYYWMVIILIWEIN